MPPDVRKAFGLPARLFSLLGLRPVCWGGAPKFICEPEQKRRALAQSFLDPKERLPNDKHSFLFAALLTFFAAGARLCQEKNLYPGRQQVL